METEKILTDWSVHAKNGAIGSLKDLIIQIPSWEIRHIVARGNDAVFVLPASLDCIVDKKRKIVKLPVPNNWIEKAPKFTPNKFGKWEETELLEYFKGVYDSPTAKVF